MAGSPTELFSTSWTLHRLSPLFHGTESNHILLENPEALSLYANRLRDMLTGDMIHDLRLTLDNSSPLDEALAKAGALKSCKWESIPTWSYWNEEHSILEDPEQDSLLVTAQQSAGILVTLEYESIRYKAALLVGPDGYLDPSNEDVTYLPLLVTRMPNALRQAFISFLGTNFDARCSILRLPSGFLCSCLESYLATLHQSVRRDSDAQEVIERVMKDVQLTLSFVSPIAPDLKSLDVSLPRQSLSELYVRGLEKGSVSSNSGDSSRKRKLGSDASTVSDDQQSTPFLSALSDYFSTHLAMDLDISTSNIFNTSNNPDKQYLRLTKVTCGAFVIGFEGRMKLLANPGRTIFLDDSHLEEEDTLDPEGREKKFIWMANEELLRRLVTRARVNQTQDERANMSSRVQT